MTFIEINNIKLHFKIEGEGFPILLIHGFSDDLMYWNSMANMLKNYFTVIRFDLRGHGKTEIGSEPINIDLYARDAVELLKRLHIKKCHIIGFSAGGSVGLNIAMKNPKLVKSLVLISTYASTNDYIKSKYKELNKALKQSYGAYYDIMIPYVLPQDIINENADILNQIKEFKIETESTENLRRILHGLKEYDELSNLNKINCKTLIIASKEDELVPYENSVAMSERINKSELVLLDYVKHNVFIENRIKEIMDIILKFLRN